MYHDFANREIEDQEMDNIRRDRQTEQVSLFNIAKDWLETAISQATNLTEDSEQTDFIKNTFRHLGEMYLSHQINFQEYLVLLQRLGVYKQDAYNDMIWFSNQFTLLEHIAP